LTFQQALNILGPETQRLLNLSIQFDKTLKIKTLNFKGP